MEDVNFVNSKEPIPCARQHRREGRAGEKPKLNKFVLSKEQRDHKITESVGPFQGRGGLQLPKSPTLATFGSQGVDK